MTEYITRLLKDRYTIALLSRGYKRKSKGFVLADEHSGVSDLGDEPYQFHRKFPDTTVAVDANRTEGIERLLETTDTGVVLLDDAFQHRKVRAGLYVLLTVYNDLYVHDTVLPAGNLRDTRNQASRADIIVVTKCPGNLEKREMDRIKEALKPHKEQEVYFATIDYDEYLHDGKGGRIKVSEIPENATLVTGIATPGPLLTHLDVLGVNYKHKAFPDHHNFSKEEIGHLSGLPFVFTTEKDFVRLESSMDGLYYLPIRVRLLEGESKFQDQLLRFIAGY